MKEKYIRVNGREGKYIDTGKKGRKRRGSKTYDQRRYLAV